MPNTPVGPPGLQSLRTSQVRKVLLSNIGAIYLAASKIIDGSQSRDPLNTGDVDVLRGGLVMGKITATGLYAPSILGTLTVAHTSNSATSMTVSAATATELVRRIGTSGTFKLVGPEVADGTVADVTITYSAVDTATGVITVSTESTDFIAGSFIMPTDGPESPLALIGDSDGIQVTDQDRQLSIDPTFTTTKGGPAMLVAGQVDASQIVNYPTDGSLKTWLKQALNGERLDSGTETSIGTKGRYLFDDDF